jgi:YggT family protein
MANFIQMLAWLLTILVLFYMVSTWIFPPYHTFRRTLSSIVEPMLAPIRSVIPPLGMFDFSGWIFIVLVQIVTTILVRLVS